MGIAQAIFNVLFGVIVGLANIFLAPINAIVSTFIPDLSSAINSFTSGLNLVSSLFSYFSYLVPPNTRALIVLYLTFLISYYTISFSVHAIIRIVEIIKKVKVW